MSTSTETRNVIIIGSGPSGYTAAVYAARASLNPLVFEGSVTAGGALMNTTEVENFPGFRDGIMGPALMDEMRAQAERFGAELVSDDVIEVDLTGDVKVVKTATDTYTARSVILSTGSSYRKLGLPREEELSGRGVSWCATCDGFFFREQAIAVIGGGDSAIEEATFLTRFGSKVYLIHRRDELRASKIMQERAFADPKLEMVWNSEVAAINGADKLESITLRDTVTGDERAARRDRHVHRDRPRPALGAADRTGRPQRRRLRPGLPPLHEDQPPRRLRRRRPRRPPLPPGHHRCRHRLRRRPRRGALHRRARPRGVHRRRRCGDRAGHRGAGADRRRLTSARPAPQTGTTVGGVVFSRHRRTDLLKGAPTVANIAAVTDAEFEAQVLKSDKPVLVDFWAEWCGPCRQVAPILDELNAEHGEKLTFLKMNVDENPVTPSSYRVTGIPTINVYQGGEVVKSIVGAKPKAALLKELDGII